MKKLFYILLVPLSILAQVTYQKSKFDQVWYDASYEKSHSTFALFDTSSIKLYYTVTGKPLFDIYDQTGSRIFHLDSLGVTRAGSLAVGTFLYSGAFFADSLRGTGFTKDVDEWFDSNGILSAGIKNGVILNEDINASAAIDGSKINPNFGAQNIETTGRVHANTLKTNVIAIADEYTLPTADGAAGQVLQTDGAGNTYWETPSTMDGFIGPNNAIKYDRKGNANIMVWIPRFNWDKTNGFNSTVVHPAFVVNGVTKSGFWVSKYENVLIDSSTKAIYSSGNVTGTTHSYIASSQPGKSARYNIDFDAARRSCTNMNNFTTITGWHLMSNAEWAAVALWAKENSTVPCGNSNYGRDNTYKHISGTIIPGDTFGSGSSRWLGGSGGVNTSHNQQESGIYDLTGNISEWVDGIMIVDGLIYVAGDKNTSPTWSGNSFAAIEANWYSTGIYVNWDGAATSFSLSAVNRGTAMSTYKSQYFGTTVGADSLLNALAIGPTISDAAVYGNDAFYANNNGSFFVFRSGTWNGGNSGSGVFFIDARYLDSQVSPTIGFRASLIE